MAHTPHELAEEFPADVDLIRELNQADGHFKKLADQYHEVNRSIHRAETNVEPMDQFHEEALRKDRMRLKDEISVMLRTAKV